MEFELLVLDGPDEGKLVRLDQTMHIGSESLCDLHLDDPYAEGFHARIDIAGDRLFARNLQENNKTLVNGMKIIDVRELNNGDVLSVGNSTIRISFYQAPRSKPAAKPKPKQKAKTDKKRKVKRPTRAARQDFAEAAPEPAPVPVAQPVAVAEPEPEPVEQHGGNPGMTMILLGFIILLAFVVYCFYWEKQHNTNDGGPGQNSAVTSAVE